MKKDAPAKVHPFFRAGSFDAQVVVGEADYRAGAVGEFGLEAQAVAEFVADAAAEVEAEAGGALFRTAVVAGEAPLAQAREVLRRDAGARVLYD